MPPRHRHVVEEDVALRMTGLPWSAHRPAESDCQSSDHVAPPGVPSRAEEHRLRPAPRARGTVRTSARWPPPRMPQDRRWRWSRSSPRHAREFHPSAAYRSWSRSDWPRRCDARTSNRPAWTNPPAPGRALHPYLRLTVLKNLCGRHRQGQQTTRRKRPNCYCPNRTSDRGRAGAPSPAPLPGHGAVRDGGQLHRERSCRTTSQTTSRAIPLDRNRPARGAGRTLNEHTCRPGHLHNVRIHSTVSTTHHHYDAATPRNLLPVSFDPSVARPHEDYGRA